MTLAFPDLESQISTHYEAVCCFGKESYGNYHSEVINDRESSMIGILI
ncbi:hypothetical protein IQ276_029780 [Desmonostoc muscorum LEGE 12446]|uniref:Uncharacterized protein n=1 Tax=Desmonostoc muscorum LEGE 12446 TaxID=1828758 RepID=A0A8J6ZRT4_DESMC|nr:hypothetical protein [Desmonostoc muscorum LEGE 12446]